MPCPRHLRMRSSDDGSPLLKRTAEVQLIRRCGTALIGGSGRRRSLTFGATAARRKRTALSISPGAVGVELMVVCRFGRRQHAAASVRALRWRACYKAEHRAATGGSYANFDCIAPTLGGAKKWRPAAMWYNDTAATQKKRALSSCRNAGSTRTAAFSSTNC
jgi:hypothetical protein